MARVRGELLRPGHPEGHCPQTNRGAVARASSTDVACVPPLICLSPPCACLVILYESNEPGVGHTCCTCGLISPRLQTASKARAQLSPDKPAQAHDQSQASRSCVPAGRPRPRHACSAARPHQSARAQRPVSSLPHPVPLTRRQRIATTATARRTSCRSQRKPTVAFWFSLQTPASSSASSPATSSPCPAHLSQRHPLQRSPTPASTGRSTASWRRVCALSRVPTARTRLRPRFSRTPRRSTAAPAPS